MGIKVKKNTFCQLILVQLIRLKISTLPRILQSATIFFGPFAQPNYQMYSVVITNNNIFTSHTARTSTQQNLQI